MTDKGFNDEALILKVKNWQTADKYAVCFSRGHGKISFLAYGARYARTNGGRLVQPFAVLDINFFAGKKLDTLKSCELISYPLQFDLKQMAYAALIAEVTENLTEEHQPQEEIYELLLPGGAFLHSKAAVFNRHSAQLPELRKLRQTGRGRRVFQRCAGRACVQ